MRQAEGERVDVPFRVLVEEVAHEVRTPLTTMRNRLLLAQARVERGRLGAEDSLALREDISHALDGIERIERLVRELAALREDDAEAAAAILARRDEVSGLVRRLMDATARRA